MLVDGDRVGELQAGESFGEVAAQLGLGLRLPADRLRATLEETTLLTWVPCTATVTARTDGRLYAIEPAVFVDVVTGHPSSAGVAGRLVRERLSERQPSPST